MKAFNDEFQSHEPVILLCKALNVDPGVDVRDQIVALDLKADGGRIHFSENCLIPTYQLGTLYRSVDCFVLTTRGEGWGMPLIEAMACGLPVIATTAGATPETVPPQAGLLVRPGDPVALARALRRVIARANKLGYEVRVGFEYEFFVFAETAF